MKFRSSRKGFSWPRAFHAENRVVVIAARPALMPSPVTSQFVKETCPTYPLSSHRCFTGNDGGIGVSYIVYGVIRGLLGDSPNASSTSKVIPSNSEGSI